VERYGVKSLFLILLQNPPVWEPGNLCKKCIWSRGVGNNLKISFKVEKMRFQSFSRGIKVIFRAL